MKQQTRASKLMEEVVSGYPSDKKAFALLAEAAFSRVVSACKFSVTIADPAQPEVPRIAVSTGFEEMTGYSRDEILGKNCRFLNFDCPMDFDQRSQIRESSNTGKPCMCILENRRKNGEIFVNMLDMRGLRIATDTETNEDIWYLVGIQSDITELVDVAAYEEGDAAAAISDSHKAQLHMIADYMRDELTKELAARAVGASMQQSPLAALRVVEAKDSNICEKKGTLGFRMASLGDLSTMDQLDNLEVESYEGSGAQSDLEWLSSRQTSLSTTLSDEGPLYDIEEDPQQKVVLPSVVLVQDPEWL
jgi:PAS domain S-box-containing protein